MADDNDLRIPFCLGNHDEQCLRRAALLMLDMKLALSTCGCETVDPADVAQQIAAHDLRCYVLQGLSCSRSSKALVSSKVSRTSHGRCGGSEVQEEVQADGTP